MVRDGEDVTDTIIHESKCHQLRIRLYLEYENPIYKYSHLLEYIDILLVSDIKQ